MKRITLLALLALIIVSCKKDITTPVKEETTIDYHQTVKTQFIEAGGTKYAYRVLGNKTGIPLILLAPSFTSIDGWDPAVTNGLAKYYKVILFDNKGVGASSGKTPDKIDDMAKDAVIFIKALGYSKVNLLGFSMGGFITQRIILTEPELVNRVILTGTGPKGSEGLSELGSTLTKISTLSPDEQLLYLLFSHSVAGRELGQQSLQRIHKRTVDRDPETTQQSNGAQVTAVLNWAEPATHTLEDLKTITQPVLIVEGRFDVLVPVVNSFSLYQNIPNSRLYLFPEAGHGSIFQEPARFLDQAKDFLDK
ncbi:pimeloyl-ACP methyl ester carboxylesterase [Pedobacter cryoconitis]|uniref:Pimeloyl-ACP methyl ester carboxylesterase n=1 Tax=Pedobacter cryoconitis TaxID=188932 RepID=A0A7W9DXN8_9SPHI|nr:alpha/beta hydrolase [Pedobacter cryoconitis]MBB5635076.1 pimeloyl-ACP methyl ester carboxylesterase [Pedobacter cryoconitis]MBB6271741.1 pimeloyl-ACP methyl ester carboxylesterase [Pedobacter cryoconitis]